jgi:hypothetical protein
MGLIARMSGTRTMKRGIRKNIDIISESISDSSTKLLCIARVISILELRSRNPAAKRLIPAVVRLVYQYSTSRIESLARITILSRQLGRPTHTYSTTQSIAIRHGRL